jgi:hypothetical protein
MILRRAMVGVAIGGVLAAMTGCAPGTMTTYAPVAHHTLKSGPDAENDVVWVQSIDPTARVAKLLRCQNTQSGPKCDEVK